MTPPVGLDRVELRVSCRPTACGISNPAVDAGAVAKVLSTEWCGGVFLLCVLVEESPKPEQVGLVAVVQAGAVRVPRGEAKP